MASYRIGIGSFNLKDGNIGIGTETTGFGNLKVEGTIKTTDLNVGVSTFTRYAGFEAEQAKFGNNVDLSGEFSSTGDIVVDTDATLTVGLGSTACIGSVECISVKHHFSVPVGDTAQRNTSSGYQEGVVRYNRDLGTMEFFNGNEWIQFNYQSDVSNSPSSRGRAVFGGGNSPSKESEIDFVNISSLGNAKDFGDMSTGMNQAAGSASETRGLLSGGYDGSSRSDNNDYITIASEGDAIDFGNLTQGRSHPGACNSSTRSLVAAGYGPNYRNEIDYVEIATIGNSVDFGDTTLARDELTGLSSPTRGIFAAGGTPSQQNLIEFVIISSKGNARNFGDLTMRSSYACGGGNGIRGIIIPGNTPSPSGTDPTFIDQIIIASEGNAVEFGTLVSKTRDAGGAQNILRGLIAGGANPSSNINVISSTSLTTSGSSEDFGDLSIATRGNFGLSDSHGGLGGF